MCPVFHSWINDYTMEQAKKSGDSSSVIKHKLVLGSVKETVVCGFQAYSELSDFVIFSKDNLKSSL